MSTSDMTRSTLYPIMVLIKASLCRPIDKNPGDMNAKSPARRRNIFSSFLADVLNTAVRGLYPPCTHSSAPELLFETLLR